MHQINFRISGQHEKYIPSHTKRLYDNVGPNFTFSSQGIFLSVPLLSFWPLFIVKKEIAKVEVSWHGGQVIYDYPCIEVIRAFSKLNSRLIIEKGIFGTTPLYHIGIIT